MSLRPRALPPGFIAPCLQTNASQRILAFVEAGSRATPEAAAVKAFELIEADR